MTNKPLSLRCKCGHRAAPEISTDYEALTIAYRIVCYKCGQATNPIDLTVAFKEWKELNNG